MSLAEHKLAACDEHLPELLRAVIPDRERRAGDVLRLDSPDSLYRCSCPKPARWFVRVFEPSDPT